MNKAVWCWLVWLSACAPLDDLEPVASRDDAIIGGTPTGLADPEVFALLRSGWPFCSATLIHPRVLITAAHCVENGVGSVSNHPLGYYNGSPFVQSTWAHPDYKTTALAEYDLAFVLLASPVTTVAPKPMQRTALPALASGRAVGYGQRSVSANPPSGERYTIDLPLTAVTSGQVRYGSPGAAICFGDSGGPFFATIDGVEKLIAVHSYTNDQTCSGGAGARLDAKQTVIEAWFAENVCPRDGRCDADCPAVDFDCTCATDGRCTADCTRPELDADCPANCGADGVCARGTCPIPDTDCRLTGALCERANQCVGQRCTSDPQHPDLYCSLACTTLADCAALDGSECAEGTCRFRQLASVAEGAACQQGDRCVDGTRCHFMDSTRSFCARPCAQQADCPSQTRCSFGFSSWQACIALPPPVTLEPLGSVELPAAPGGCSTSAGSLLTLGLAVLLARPGRRRRVTSAGGAAASACPRPAARG